MYTYTYIYICKYFVHANLAWIFGTLSFCGRRRASLLLFFHFVSGSQSECFLLRQVVWDGSSDNQENNCSEESSSNNSRNSSSRSNSRSSSSISSSSSTTTSSSSSSSSSSARRRALESERARLQQQLESERAKLKAVVQEIVDQERADSSVGHSGPGNMLGSTTKEGGSTTKVGGSRQMIANMSMVELSSRVKKRTGKAWGGHWSKRHGPLLHFVQTHCLMGEVRASCKSGVRLLAQQHAGSNAPGPPRSGLHRAQSAEHRSAPGAHGHGQTKSFCVSPIWESGMLGPGVGSYAGADGVDGGQSRKGKGGTSDTKKAGKKDRSRICAKGGCGALIDESKRCSRCSLVYYCSRDCQRADWKAHKPKCNAAVEEKAAQDARANAQRRLRAASKGAGAGAGAGESADNGIDSGRRVPDLL